MAESDITGGNPDLRGRGNQTNRPSVAARIGAKVTTDGVEALNRKFKDLLATLRSVRTEMQSINNGGQATAGGLSNNQSTSRLGNMISGFSAAGAASVGMMGVGVVNNRMTRNMVQSAGISATDTLYSSRYGFDYRSAESNRFEFTGKFGGSREEQQRAWTLGFSYGQTPTANLNFLGSMANVVQASGGTMSIGQAAESVGDFMDPMVQRRAAALGIPMMRQQGQIGNPRQVALGYIKDYERRQGTTMNDIDFANSMSQGSRFRYTAKKLYNLDDSAITQVLEAGQQNFQFRQQTGSSRDINFNNSSDLDDLGLSANKLGLQTQALTTAVGRRESRFFASQEGAMVQRLGQDITIQNTLSDVEDAFGGVIGVLYQFENAIKVVTGAMGAMSMMGMMGGGGGMGGMGGMGMGGGVPGVPGVPGAGGVPGGAPGGAGGAAGRIGGFLARGGAMRVAGGVGLAFGAYQMSTNTHNAGGLLGSIAMGAGSGAMLGGGVPGAVVGGTIAGVTALNSWAKSIDQKNVGQGATEALTLDDQALIDSIQDYVKGNNAGWGGAGPKQRGRFDIWAARRGMLISAMLDEALSAGVFKDLDGARGAKLGSLMNVYSNPEAVKNDQIWNMSRKALDEVLPELMSSREGRNIYKTYFGNVAHPYDYTAVKTDQYKSLVLSGEDVARSTFMPQGGSGDPVGVNTSGVGGATGKGVGPGNASWDKMDPRMKERISRLMAESGGRVWVGEGYRDPGPGHEAEFYRRHVEDPNGEREYKGKRYRLRPGMAPLAPPGRSNHNIGMAADLQGDLTWVQQNASRFGLKTFANVNNEPWHVQLSELPNGFLGEYASGGGEDTSATGDAMSEHGVATGFGGGMVVDSGVGFSISKIMAGSLEVFAGGGGWAGTGASTTSGGIDTSYSGGKLTAEQVAKMAYAAGFRGQDLVNVVAIAGRESGYNPMAHNPNRDTGDNSYGLMQINMIDSLGPSRLQQFGISSNEQLFDPMTNLRAAFMLYQQSGNQLTPWGGYKGMANTYSTDLEAAARAVANSGIGGDPVDSAMRPAFGSGGGASTPTVSITFGDIKIESSGSAAYDADMFVRTVAPRLEEAVGMSVKRTQG